MTPSESRTAWVIEELWSGHIHYVHRDFDAAKWIGKRNRMIDSRNTFLITKLIDEAMTFDTKEAADAWRANQPRWMRGGQYEAREHMWVDVSESRTGEALKPCPFCGETKINHLPGQLIACTNVNCGGQVEMGSPWGGPKEVGVAFLISAWNTRTPPPAGEGGEALRRALRYYADVANYVPDGKHWTPPIDADKGALARAALQADTGEGGKGLREAFEGIDVQTLISDRVRADMHFDLYGLDDAAEAIKAAFLTAAQPLRSGDGS